jgi:hypothetical protein
MQYIGLIAAFVAGCTILHLAIIWAWQHCSWTAAKPLPTWMHPPAAELLLLNLLGLPLAMYSVILLVQAQHPDSKVLGTVVGLAVLLYLICLALVLRLIFSNKPRLGLMYVPVRQPSSRASISWRWSRSASLVSAMSWASRGDSRAIMPSSSKTLGPGPSNADEATTRTV